LRPILKTKAMRLGQLARKLELSPTEIISFLSEKNISATEGSNTRLTQDQVIVICAKFDPTDSKQILSAPDKKEEAKSVAAESNLLEPQSIIIESIIESANAPTLESEPDLISESVSTEESTPEVIEVIKAPKVELSGLKILGKIELPQPKKKEDPVESEQVQEENVNTENAPAIPEKKIRRYENRNENRKFSGSKNPRQTSGKNPIALQREREVQEQERKREEELKLQKEKRTQHYLQKVKSVPTKRASIIDEEVVEMKADHSVVPKTLFGKFWKWFRS
jgi:hypothetical protein